jgi:hypothetical protein
LTLPKALTFPNALTLPKVLTLKPQTILKFRPLSTLDLRTCHKFSVNGENLPVITGKLWKINKNQYTPQKTRLKILPVLTTREHYTSLLHWV